MLFAKCLQARPVGTTDRSLARSAWKSVPRKSRPVGYGVIRAGVRTDSNSSKSDGPSHGMRAGKAGQIEEAGN